MAFQPQTIPTFFTRSFHIATRFAYLYSRPPISASFSFCTLQVPHSCITNQPHQNDSKIDESHVLNQLSDLLPIKQTKPVSLISAGADSFLPPEDKLRGIFLQKIRNKSCIKNALDKIDVELSADLVAKVVNKGNLSSENMIMFFSWAVEQPTVPKSVELYHVILKALGRRKFFKHMVEMFREMRGPTGIKPNSETLFVILDSFVRARQVSKAMQVFRNLEDFGLESDTETLNVMLRCLSRRRHVGAASSLVGKMKGKIAFDAMTYNVVIAGWSRLGRVDEVEKFLGAMVEDGFDPDNLTYSYILEGLGRAGKVDDAVKVFESLMEKECGRLDAVVYNAMISNFIAVGNIDECLKYYVRMLSNKCELNMDTFSRIISALLEARRVADALEMFDDMLARGIVPTTGTITSFLEPLCSYGPPHAALVIYKKARKYGCRVSLTAYKLLLMRLSRLGKCGMLLTIWDEMHESGHSSDMEVYEHVISGLCNIGQLENAVLVMEEALKKGFFPSKLVCSKLKNKLLAANKVEIAYKLLLKIKVARGNENVRRYCRAKGWHY